MTTARVILIHGGYWRARYGASSMEELEADLRARGYAVTNVEYRSLGNGGGWPVTFDDVLAAIDEAANDDYTRPVVVIGHSAGGQLALWAAGERDVAGVVAQAGVTDLREAFDRSLSNGVVRELLGGAPDEVPERYAAASPIERLPLGIPQLLVHGDDDDDVPVELSRTYAAAAERDGDDVEYVELPGVGHFEHLDPTSIAWRTVIDWLTARW